MNWPVDQAWLKNTIPGIIVLGAIGSIVAFFLLKLAAIIGRKLSSWIIPRLIVLNVRPFTTGAIHCRRFLNSNRPAHLIIYATGLVVALNGWFVIASICLVATAVVIVQVGPTARGLLVTLIGATGLALIMFFRELLYVAGAAAVLFRRDMAEVSKAFKDPDFVMAVTGELVKDLKPQPPSAQPTPAAAPIPAPPSHPPSNSSAPEAGA